MNTAPTAGSLLQQLSREIADTIEMAGQSVVRVNARRRLPGTGIVWSSGNGSVIATANHIVERDEDITVVTADGRELPATLLGRDAEHDLAALSVTENLPVAPRNNEAIVGSFAFAIGRAGYLSATSGVISAVMSGRHRRQRRTTQLISTDAPMFPGFSGGPLIDASGSVVGLLSSHLGRGQTMGIPVGEVDRVITAIGTHGRVRHGYIGISAQQVSLPESLSAATASNQQHGLLLIGVEEGGPAAKAGLSIGDIVLSIAGQETSGLEDVRAALGPETIEQAVDVSLLRGGTPMTVSVTVDERPE